MLSEGYRIPVVGTSDSHNTKVAYPDDLFNNHFTIAFAKDFSDIPNAVKEERATAVDRRSDTDFRAIGKFRYVKYSRFLMREYYPSYAALCNEHAKAMMERNTEDIANAERRIADFKKKFFAIYS